MRMGPFPFILVDDRRHRRVAELIAILWLLALADLFFTLWAHFFTPFSELNPVASYMLRQNLVPSLILYKLVVTAIGTLIFWRLREYGRAEIALWGLVGTYVLLTMRWSNYTNNVLALI
jgi:hypothetical protein